MSNDDLEFRISKIKLEPGDILVLKTPRPITGDMAARLRDIFERLSPGFKTLILDQGMELAVVNEADLAKLARVPA